MASGRCVFPSAESGLEPARPEVFDQRMDERDGRLGEVPGLFGQKFLELRDDLRFDG